MAEQWPDRIYLQWYDDDGESLDRFTDEITWCCDIINDNDLEYLLATPERKAAHDLLAACAAFVEAYEKSLQLEKTDVALRLARAALAKARPTPPSAA